MRLPYFEYHSFPDGDAPFTGNPAGVCLLEAFPADDVLRGIAESNKHAETAYLVAKPGEADAWDLRWFTPELEVDLCGHATLAAAATVFDEGMVQGEAAHFDTRSGRLVVARDGGALRMAFPSVPFSPIAPEPGVEDALGGAPVRALFEIKPIHGRRYLMAVLADEAMVAGLAPDLQEMKRQDTNIVATARGGATDFVSRFFAPCAGIDEDPVTGSAHCTLAPYWAEQLGRTRMTARQIGPRPGALEIQSGAGADGDQVLIFGSARRYLVGEIFV